MRQIFTYPANGATDFIDPLYVGDATSGFTRRVDELLAGTYKDWVNLDPVSDLGTTTSEAMQNFSKYEYYFNSVKNVDNLAMYDLWRNPIVIASKSPSAGPNDINGGTINLSEDTLTTTTTHNFQDGDLAVFKGVDGSWGQLYNNRDLYVKRVDANTMKFSLNSGLSPLIDITNPFTYDNNPLTNPDPLRLTETYDQSSGSKRIILHVTEHTLKDGDQVEFTSILNPNIDNTTYYAQAVPDGFLNYDNSNRYFLFKDAALAQAVTQDDAFPSGTGTDLTVINGSNPGVVELLSAPTDGKIWISEPIEFRNTTINPTVQRGKYLKPTATPNQYELYLDPGFTMGYNFDNKVIDRVELFFHNFIDGTPYNQVTMLHVESPSSLNLQDGDPVLIPNIDDTGANMENVTYYVEDMPGSHYFKLYEDAALTTPLLRDGLGMSDKLYYLFRSTDGDDNFLVGSAAVNLEIPYTYDFVAQQDFEFWNIDNGDVIKIKDDGQSPSHPYNRTKAAPVTQTSFSINNIPQVPPALGDNKIKLWSDKSGFSDINVRTKLNFTGSSNSGLSSNSKWIEPSGRTDNGWTEYHVYDNQTGGTALDYPVAGNQSGIRVDLTPQGGTNPGLVTLSRELDPSEYKVTMNDDILDLEGGGVVTRNDFVWLQPTGNPLEYEMYQDDAQTPLPLIPGFNHRIEIDFVNFDVPVGDAAQADLNSSSYTDGQEARFYQDSTRLYQNNIVNQADRWPVNDTLGNMRDVFTLVDPAGNRKYAKLFIKYVSGTTYELYTDEALTQPFNISATDMTDTNANPQKSYFVIKYNNTTGDHEVEWWYTNPIYGAQYYWGPGQQPGDSFPDTGAQNVAVINDSTGVFTDGGTYYFTNTGGVWTIHANQDRSDDLTTGWPTYLPSEPFIDYYGYSISQGNIRRYGPYEWTPFDTGNLDSYVTADLDESTVEIRPQVAGTLTATKGLSPIDYVNWKAQENKEVSMEMVNYVVSDPKWYPATQGNITADITLANPATPTTGVIELSPNGGITYNVTGVDIVMPGTKEYKYLSAADTYSPGAVIDASQYWQAGDVAITTIDPSDTAATFSVGVGGGVFGGYLDSVSVTSGGAYSDPSDMLLIVENAPDTYTPPTPTPAEQQDTFDTQDYWDDLGNDDRKQWPRHVTPSSAQIVQSSPSIVNVSQNGVKFTKTSSFTKWKLEVTYPPMSADDFRKFHAVSQAVNGQATPFLFFLKSKEGDDILWNDFPVLGSSDELMYREDVSAGDKVVLVEGLRSFEPNAFVEGEVIYNVNENNQNGNLVTVVTGTDANVFGEAKIRLAYPLRQDEGSGSKLYKHPESCIVTLSEDDFQYSVDYNSLYYLTVSFDLDGWK
jgi:hypothetical protein